MFEDCAKLAEAYLKANWTDAACPIRFENTPFEQPQTGVWVAFAVLPSLGRRQSLGPSHVERQFGLLSFQFFDKKDAGSRATKKRADAAADIFREVRIKANGSGQLLDEGGQPILDEGGNPVMAEVSQGLSFITRTPQLVPMGERVDYFQQNMTVPFVADAIFD